MKTIVMGGGIIGITTAWYLAQEGHQVTVLERRDAWTRVRIASGAAGWVPSGTIQHISL